MPWRVAATGDMLERFVAEPSDFEAVFQFFAPDVNDNPPTSIQPTREFVTI